MAALVQFFVLCAGFSLTVEYSSSITVVVSIVTVEEVSFPTNDISVADTVVSLIANNFRLNELVRVSTGKTCVDFISCRLDRERFVISDSL